MGIAPWRGVVAVDNLGYAENAVLARRASAWDPDIVRDVVLNETGLTSTDAIADEQAAAVLALLKARAATADAQRRSSVRRR